MAKTLIEAIGYKLGQKMAQAKNAFDLMGGSEEESLRAEIRLGRDMASALLERTPPVEENLSTRYAQQVGQWLAANLEEKHLPFSVQVTGEPVLNALALPGGPIFMSWPLLELCQGRRDEIAFVVGHEMGHIVRRHTLDRLVKDAAVSLLLRQASGRHAASVWLSQAGRQLLSRAFSRDQELEADAFAQDLVQRAGGDPMGGVRLLGKLALRDTRQRIGVAGDYFATHPSPSERMAQLKARGASGTDSATS